MVKMMAAIIIKKQSTATRTKINTFGSDVVEVVCLELPLVDGGLKLLLDNAIFEGLLVVLGIFVEFVDEVVFTRLKCSIYV